jgi:hypothetical protein
MDRARKGKGGMMVWSAEDGVGDRNGLVVSV